VEAYHPVAALAVVVVAALADLPEVEALAFPYSCLMEEVALPFPDVVGRAALALVAFLDVDHHQEEAACHPQEEEDVGDHRYRQEEEGRCS
jgi:hypothetical protein